MKQITSTLTALLAFGMLTLGSTTADAQNTAAPKNRTVTATTTQAMQPQVIRSYYKDPDTEDWIIEMIDSVKYNQELLPITNRLDYYAEPDYIEYSLLSTYTYNEYGLQTSETCQLTFDQGNTWDNFYRLTYGYDTEAQTSPTSLEEYEWDPEISEWIYNEYAGGTYFMDITRDADKRVTETTQYVNGSRTQPQVRRTFEYDADGNLTKINWEFADLNGKLVPTYCHTDLYFIKNDGHYVYPTDDVYEPFGYDPDNMLESYMLYHLNADGTQGEIAAAWSANYDEQMRCTYSRLKKEDGGAIAMSYQYDLDENGSYDRMRTTRIPSDEGDIIELERSVYTLDAHGNIARMEIFAVDPETGAETLQFGDIEERTYNADGNLETLIAYSNSGNEYESYMKQEFADYVDATTTGIAHITSSSPRITANNGRISVTSARGARYTITDMNGKTVRHGIVNGDITTEGLPHGMYIINIDGSNARTAVKLISK